MSDNELEMDLLIKHATEDKKFIFFQGKNEEKLEIRIRAARKSTVIQQFLEKKKEDLINNNDIILYLPNAELVDLKKTNYKSVSKVSSFDISNAFDALGLKDDDFKEISDDEESIFQKVLAKKMVCDICMARMKTLLCPDCSNPICSKCFADLPQKTCQFCRKANNQFVPIKLPRL